GTRQALRALRNGYGPKSGPDTAHARAAAHDDAFLDGIFLLTDDREARARASSRQPVRPHLRSLLLGCAVRRARPGNTEDPRLRRHGFTEMARIRALQAVPAFPRLPPRVREA